MLTPSPAQTAPRQPRKRKRPNYWLRRLMVLVILLLPLATWRAWAGFKEQIQIKPEAPAERVVASKPIHVVLLGVDERNNDVGRSDTMMLLRIAPKAQTVDIVNIPRDTQIKLGSNEAAKINAAFSVGGADEVTQIVSDMLGIPRPYYVKINFQAFEKIIDKLDGVDIHVDRHYVYDDPFQDLHIDIQPGLQHMNGETALKFVRIRYDGRFNDDISRISRQQQFMEALRQKIANPANIIKVPDLLSTLKQYVKTNIPEADQLMLAEALFKSRNNIRMQTLPGQPDDSTGNWIFDSTVWNEVTSKWPAN